MDRSSKYYHHRHNHHHHKRRTTTTTTTMIVTATTKTTAAKTTTTTSSNDSSGSSNTNNNARSRCKRAHPGESFVRFVWPAWHQRHVSSCEHVFPRFRCISTSVEVAEILTCVSRGLRGTICARRSRQDGLRCCCLCFHREPLLEEKICVLLWENFEDNFKKRALVLYVLSFREACMGQTRSTSCNHGERGR